MARILFVNKASMIYPGGAETRMRAVASAWAKSGHDVYLICAKTSCEELPLEVVEGVTIRRIRVMPDVLLRHFPVPHYLPQALFYLISWPHILFYLRKWRISAIRDSMSPFPGLGLLAPWLGRRGIVVLHILYGGYSSWRKFYSAPYALLGAAGERLLLSGWLGYRAIITDSPWLAKYVQQKRTAPLQVTAIENGIELTRLAVRTAKGQIQRLVNAGRFVEHKGHLDLIDACRQLQETGVPFTLHLFGDGPLRSLIQRKINEFGLSGSVSLFPALSHDQLLQRLSDYDLYVLPSVVEGLPVVLLEAMAAQVPIVVPKREYATTLLSPELACFYDPVNSRSLAQTIAWGLQNPVEVERMAAAGRRFVTRFSWERTATLELAELRQATGAIH